MKKGTQDNVAKFFFDCGKLTFAVLVVGVFARQPFIPINAIWGFGFTLILFITGVIINQFEVKEDAK